MLFSSCFNYTRIRKFGFKKTDHIGDLFVTVPILFWLFSFVRQGRLIGSWGDRPKDGH